MRPDVERWLHRRTSPPPTGRSRSCSRPRARTTRQRRAAGARRGGHRRRDRRRDPPPTSVRRRRRARRRARRHRLRQRPTRTAERAAAAGATRRAPRRRPAASCRPLPGKGEVLWRSLAATDRRRRWCSSTPTCASFTPVVRHRAARAAAHRPRGRAGQGGCTTGRWRDGRDAAARRRRPGHRARRAPAAQPALARARRRRAAAGRRVRRPPRACSSRCRSRPATASSSALLVDTLELAGLDAIAQVDLGVRLHRHQDDARLGPDGQRDHAGGAGPARAGPGGVRRAGAGQPDAVAVRPRRRRPAWCAPTTSSSSSGRRWSRVPEYAAARASRAA